MTTRPAPRLLEAAAAADYLSLPLAVLRKITQGRVRIGTRVRWDRVALDAWLDELAGLAPQSTPAQGIPAPAADNDPEAAFERSSPRL